MADAVDVVQAIIQLGSIAKNKASQSVGGDWTSILSSLLTDPTGKQSVMSLFSIISGNGLSKAIADLQAKEQKILDGKQIEQLSGQDLLNYAALSRGELVLATKGLIQALDGGLLDWIVNTAVPILVTVLPAILAL